MGDRLAYLEAAQRAISTKVGYILKASSVYETAPWGKTDQANFYNQILMLKTSLNPFEVLEQTQSIEDELGRQRIQHWGARTLDIDLIFYDNQCINTDKLILPHPLMQERNFVLEPFAEIAPDYKHPLFNKTIKELLLLCEDQLPASKIALMEG